MSRSFGRRVGVLSYALFWGLCGAAYALGEDQTLGTIRAPSEQRAWQLTQQTLAQMGSAPELLERATAVWTSHAHLPLLDRVVETLLVADPQARAVLEAARDESAPAPLTVPDWFRDSSRPVFLRANVAVYYAKLLGTRRIHEEALHTLKLFRPEQVVDPASYYFFKAAAEHKLQLKEDGLASIHRLLTSVIPVPERYRVVAELMKTEMEQWRDEDLGRIARDMDNVERRLDLARGGPKTQQLQKDIVARLDKLIEQLEQQCQSCSAGSGTIRSSAPATDSRIMKGAGPGQVDQKHLVRSLELWGKLPEKEKIKALEEISRNYPPHYREAIEEYLRRAARGR